MNFRLKHALGVYKLKPQLNTYISNKNLTDDLAIEFLSFDDKRIALFSEYPEDWKVLVGIVEDIEVVAEVVEEKPCSPCQKRKDLMEVNMADLKEQYPDIKAGFGMKKVDYVNEIIDSLYPKEDK